MNKTYLILRREFLYRIRKRSFVLLTLFMPILFAAIILIPAWLSTINDSKSNIVMVVDQTGKYMPCLKDEAGYRFVTASSDKEKYKIEQEQAMAVLSISGDLSMDASAAVLYSHDEVPLSLTRLVNDCLSRQIRHDKLSRFHVAHLEKILTEAETDYHIQTIRWNVDGKETQSDATVAAVVGYVFTFLIYFFVMTYGAMIMQGVVEEKSNRIIELLVSSVKPFSLMMGKILGIMFVGLLQMLIWIIIVGVILLVAIPMTGISSATNLNGGAWLEVLGNLPLLELSLMFIFYFIGGYLLYASFCAAAGASINNQEDTAQFMLPIVLLMIFALYAALFSANAPNGPLAFWCSLIPLTSPIVMMMRLPFGVPLWQEVLSLAILYTSAFSVIWVSGRIYRVGILLYGKKPSLREMMKWIGNKKV